MNQYQEAYNRIQGNVKGIKQKHRAIARKYKRIEEDMGLLGQGINFGGMGGGTVPALPSGSPWGWYDATRLSLSHNDMVASWTDETGNGNHLAQTSDARKPLYNTGAHALPVVSFNGVNGEHRLFKTATISHPLSIFIVVKQNSWTASKKIMDGITDNSLAFQQFGTSPNTVVYAGAILNSTGEALSTWQLYSIVLNGASSIIRIDGSNEVTGAVGGNTSLGGFDLGAQGNSSNSHIDVGELIIYDGVENVADNEAYLMSKWGI